MADSRQRVPRLGVGAMSLAICSHLWAAVTGFGVSHHIPVLHWVALAAAETVLVAVMFARPSSFSIRRFRLPGVAVTALSILILVPLPSVVRLYRDHVPYLMVLSIAAGLLVFAIVFLCAGEPVPRSPVGPSSAESKFPTTIVVAGLVLLPIWIRSLGSLPILDLLSGRAQGLDIALARQDALDGLTFTPLRLAIGALRNLYLMFAVGWLVADLVSTPLAEWRARSRKRLAFSVALGTASVFALVTTERAIIGQVGVVAVIAYFAARRKNLSLGATLSLSGLALGFPLIFGLANGGGGGGSPIAAAIESVRRRLLFVPTDVLVNYFISFPERHEFLRGASIPKVQRLFGGETFNLSSYIYEVSYRFDDSFTGIANGSFIGVGWANFGFVGVMIWFAIAALAIVWVDRLIDTMPLRSSAAIRGVAAVQTVLLTSADVTRTLLNVAPGFLDLVIVVLAVRWWSDRAQSMPPTTRVGRAVDDGSLRMSSLQRS